MAKKKYTNHSEYLPLESVLLSPVAPAFESSQKLKSQWRQLNYLEEPALEEAISEYEAFTDILDNEGVKFQFLPGAKQLSLDSVYCRDASIATDHGMIICRMGKEARLGEPEIHKWYYHTHEIPILGEIKAPGTLEGGDVAWIDSNTLAVGQSYRTNTEGIKQLRVMLSAHQVNILEVDLPHFKGPNDVFHLMSVFSPVDKDLAVVYSPLLPIRFRNELLNRGYLLVEVPDDEFMTMGCNVLAIAPRKCIMLRGNPITEKELISAGCTVLSYDGLEISLKGGGGPTCLTRPISRRSG
ncbi:MAG: dimethylarginine dimethylaminohydrolase family protein [Flavobacteriaceae bacterium]